jgi:Tfp pilus assembly protein PilF
VYKDDNASTLSRNYAAAHMELAYAYRANHQLDRAIEEMQRVEKMFPGYPDVQITIGGFYIDRGDTARAIQVFTRLAKEYPGDGEVLYYYGIMLMFQNKPNEALQQFERSMQLAPDYPNSYLWAYSLLRDRGQQERAVQILEAWVSRHPEDPQARALLEGHRRQTGQTPLRPGAPPTIPNLP